MASRRQFLKLSATFTFASSTIAKTVIGQRPDSAPDELHYASVAQLSSWIASGKISSEEATRAVIERQRRVNPAINAVVTSVNVEVAMAQAKEADARASRRMRKSRLDGVPCTIKDNIETAGIVTTNGCPELQSYVPTTDATVVRRLKSAGAIVLGKTNVPEMCMDGDTDNVIFKRTRNPYNVARVPGGSSGGEAAIIASGGSSFGIGTDIGGSIRQPAHCCGIAGIKPTTGRVPGTGVFNSFHPSTWDWNGIGPMARSVEDLAIILEAIAGPDNRDPFALRGGSWTWRSIASLKELKILCIPEDGYSSPAKATSATVAAAVGVLEEAGLRIESKVPPFFHTAHDRWVFNQVPDWAIAIRGFRQEYARLGRPASGHHYQTEWLLRMIDAWTPQFDERRRMDEKLLLDKFRQEMVATIDGFDALIMPVQNTPAGEPTSAEQYDKITIADYESFKKQGNLCAPFNLMGWPVVVVRCGTSDDGLPIGLQVVAKPWREDVALTIASFLEGQIGGWRPPRVAE